MKYKTLARFFFFKQLFISFYFYIALGDCRITLMYFRMPMGRKRVTSSEEFTVIARRAMF